VYDASGARVATLVDARLPAGRHRARWNGADGRGARVASGVYFCRLEAAGEERTRKLVLLK
jgi:flagellar hook assembly protein FlgD